MGRVLFLVLVASVLNFGSGMSIPPTLGTPPTMGTPEITYGNSNDPFANWFLSKLFMGSTFRLPISCDWPQTVAHNTGMNCRSRGSRGTSQLVYIYIERLNMFVR